MRFLSLKSLRAILFQYVFIKLYRVYLPLNFKQSYRILIIINKIQDLNRLPIIISPVSNPTSFVSKSSTPR